MEDRRAREKNLEGPDLAGSHVVPVEACAQGVAAEEIRNEVNFFAPLILVGESAVQLVADPIEKATRCKGIKLANEQEKQRRPRAGKIFHCSLLHLSHSLKHIKEHTIDI